MKHSFRSLVENYSFFPLPAHTLFLARYFFSFAHANTQESNEFRSFLLAFNANCSQYINIYIKITFASANHHLIAPFFSLSFSLSTRVLLFLLLLFIRVVIAVEFGSHNARLSMDTKAQTLACAQLEPVELAFFSHHERIKLFFKTSIVWFLWAKKVEKSRREIFFFLFSLSLTSQI